MAMTSESTAIALLLSLLFTLAAALALAVWAIAIGCYLAPIVGAGMLCGMPLLCWAGAK